MTAILWFGVNVIVGLSLGYIGLKGAKRIDQKYSKGNEKE